MTEGTKRPDFLIPGIDRYHDLSWPVERLLMLGAKTSCKDRWRQVLTDADRIPAKHLLTLESPISTAQLEEMSAAQLALVIPSGLHGAFANPNRSRLLSVRDFLELASQIVGHHRS